MSKQDNIFDFLQEIYFTLKNVICYPDKDSWITDLTVNLGDKILLSLKNYDGIDEDISNERLKCKITGTREGKYTDIVFTFLNETASYEHCEEFEDKINIQIYKINENDENEYLSDYSVTYEKINPQTFNSIIEKLIEKNN